MKDHINAIIIGVAIVIAAVLVVRSFPRYQYGENIHTDKSEHGTTETTEAYVFDMVTGKRYTHSFFMYLPNDRSDTPRTLITPSKEPRHSVLEAWAKQLELFGTKPTDGKQWKAWKDAHPEW